MSNVNKLKRFKQVLLVVVLISFLVIHFFVPRLITEIQNPVVGLIKRNRNVSFDVVSGTNSKIKTKEFEFNSFDNTILSANITYTTSDTLKGTIILLHGIRSSKNH
ncbi:hypothetical protein OAE03_03160, partial [Winogradskyella sp.]|nr:hypothetical protein [Winogradskyella sp.]